MPTFNTPVPIDLAINLPVGAIDVVASDRADTVVSVSAPKPAKAVDPPGPQEYRVDIEGHRRTHTRPKPT
ncbi:MAG: hypothetical protein ABWX92_16465, partial [Mycetocola sp.]